MEEIENLIKDGFLKLGNQKFDVFIATGTRLMDFYLEKQPQAFGREPVHVYEWDCAKGNKNARLPQFLPLTYYFSATRLQASGNINSTLTANSVRSLLTQTGTRNEAELEKEIEKYVPPVLFRIDWAPFKPYFNAANKVTVVCWVRYRDYVLRSQAAPNHIYVLSRPVDYTLQMIITGHCEAELEEQPEALEGNSKEVRRDPNAKPFLATQVVPLPASYPLLQNMDIARRGYRRDAKRAGERRERRRTAARKEKYRERLAAKD